MTVVSTTTHHRPDPQAGRNRDEYQIVLEDYSEAPVMRAYGTGPTEDVARVVAQAALRTQKKARHA